MSLEPRDGKVMQGLFSFLYLVGSGMEENEIGPWQSVCLSGYTGPTWGFVHVESGDFIPMSAVLRAVRA